MKSCHGLVLLGNDIHVFRRGTAGLNAYERTSTITLPMTLVGYFHVYSSHLSIIRKDTPLKPAPECEGTRLRL